ncbi:MAG TPA: PhzF family phenazine biosynthesis protein [Chthoniobacterales bacterium]|nr:PhzF family phenazine biosynthesis protein [Chthoniobacterales bacterium]
MTIPYFQIQAFTKDHFAGNPAGVCLLGEWLPDARMQAIAAENNLSETAFLIERERDFDLRWFTPTVEVDLCGHATLAAAHVIFRHLGRMSNEVIFQSRSGSLTVARVADRLVLDFPAEPLRECEPPPKLSEGLGAQAKSVLRGRDYFAVFGREEDVSALTPDFEVLAQLDAQGVVVTARGNSCDFVSRCFGPKVGIPEDPVTGSTHCALIPYWSKRLGKKQLHARQLSQRSGELYCEDRGERVGIGGNAVTYLTGNISIS